MSTTPIDDLLFTNRTASIPPTSESLSDVPRETPEAPESEILSEEIAAPLEASDDYGLDEPSEEKPITEPPKEDLKDDYGNDIPKPKLFSEDEVNERINLAVRERLARLERNQPVTQQQAQQTQQAAQGFEYNADSQESWQQQLETFVESTVSRMGQRQQQQATQQREQQAQAEFETKFQQGMSKFADYVDTVQSQPITDHMVLAARSMKDPAAFFYAAAKRAPQELQRIANIRDPYAQIAEIGKLEERMKQSKPTTKAPKPVSKTQADSQVRTSTDKRQPSIEELIAKDQAKRLALVQKRRG
ncbi:MAG: hypothetical protein ACREGC_02675 [Minisyncoccia bacterium]